METQKLLHLATRYTLLGDILYKKSYSKFHTDPYLRCLGPDETQRMLKEIHDGNYRNHSGGAPSLMRSSIKGITGPRCSMMPKICKKMVPVLEICPNIKQTEYRPPHFAKSLVLHAMGVGRGWSTLSRAVEVAVPIGSHQLLHQIGRSGATLRTH